MVITHEEVYRDMIDSLVTIWKDEADDMDCSLKRVKKDLFANDDEERLIVDINYAKEQFENTIDNLKEIVDYLDTIVYDVEQDKQKAEQEREDYEEYRARYKRMLSLP